MLPLSLVCSGVILPRLEGRLASSTPNRLLARRRCRDRAAQNQEYVNVTADCQTAALIACRAAPKFAPSWKRERFLAGEWVETYFDRLNEWQFWIAR